MCVPRVSTEGGQSGELLVEAALEECLGDIVIFIMAAQLAKEVQVRQL